MTQRVTIGLVILLVASTMPALAAAGGQQGLEAGTTGTTAALAASDGGNATVNVSVGAQLGTVVARAEGETRTDIEDSIFEFRFETEADDRDEAVADRLEELRDRAEEIRDEYNEATEAYEEGEISKDEYARRLAGLAGRAENVEASLVALENRTESRSVTVNRTAIREVRSGVANVSGAGPSVLLSRFTGQSTGELELRTNGGLRIEAESEDGERTREIRRDGDNSTEITISEATALDTARAALSDQPGNWTLERATRHEEDGEWRFEFGFATATETGEAEVRVDGSADTVVRIEEEIEPLDDEDDAEIEDPETEDDDDVETEDPETEDDDDGETEDPETEDAETETEDAETETDDGETETETDTETETESSETVAERLNASISVEDGTATAVITLDGDALSDAVVDVDSEEVGTTDDDGRVSFAVPETDEAVDFRVQTDDVSERASVAFENGTATIVEDFDES